MHASSTGNGGLLKQHKKPLMPPCRIGLVGFGALGRYLYDRMLQDPLQFLVVWVFNRTPKHEVDLIIEVCHPSITAEFGGAFLSESALFLGSPTAMADSGLESVLRKGSESKGLYIPSGALWGATDILKMGSAGIVGACTVTMKKHPSSLLLEPGEPRERLDAAVAGGVVGETILYDGPVRGLAILAPNNVNTMAAAAIAARNLGFDGVRAVLISDPSLTAHIVEIEVEGKPFPDGQKFSCKTVRYNPAAPGAVTGNATYASFFASLKIAAASCQGGRGRAGLHMC